MGINFELKRKDDEQLPVAQFAETENVEAAISQRDEPKQEADDKMVLRTDNLVKKYGKRTVVNHVSIDVTQGEIVGLLGPKRCRKDDDVLYDSRSCSTQ